jgi:hypothetical protein
MASADGLLEVVPEFPADEEEWPTPWPIVADPELVERIRLELGFVLGRQDGVVGFRGTLNLLDQYPRAMVAVLGRAGHLLP